MLSGSSSLSPSNVTRKFFGRGNSAPAYSHVANTDADVDSDLQKRIQRDADAFQSDLHPHVRADTDMRKRLQRGAAIRSLHVRDALSASADSVGMYSARESIALRRFHSPLALTPPPAKPSSPAPSESSPTPHGASPAPRATFVADVEQAHARVHSRAHPDVLALPAYALEHNANPLTDHPRHKRSAPLSEVYEDPEHIFSSIRSDIHSPSHSASTATKKKATPSPAQHLLDAYRSSPSAPSFATRRRGASKSKSLARKLNKRGTVVCRDDVLLHQLSSASSSVGTAPPYVPPKMVKAKPVVSAVHSHPPSSVPWPDQSSKDALETHASLPPSSIANLTRVQVADTASLLDGDLNMETLASLPSSAIGSLTRVPVADATSLLDGDLDMEILASLPPSAIGSLTRVPVADAASLLDGDLDMEVFPLIYAVAICFGCQDSRVYIYGNLNNANDYDADLTDIHDLLALEGWRFGALGYGRMGDRCAKCVAKEEKKRGRQTGAMRCSMNPTGAVGAAARGVSPGPMRPKFSVFRHPSDLTKKRMTFTGVGTGRTRVRSRTRSTVPKKKHFTLSPASQASMARATKKRKARHNTLQASATASATASASSGVAAYPKRATSVGAAGRVLTRASRSKAKNPRAHLRSPFARMGSFSLSSKSKTKAKGQSGAKAKGQSGAKGKGQSGAKLTGAKRQSSFSRSKSKGGSNGGGAKRDSARHMSPSLSASEPRRGSRSSRKSRRRTYRTSGPFSKGHFEEHGHGTPVAPTRPLAHTVYAKPPPRLTRGSSVKSGVGPPPLRVGQHVGKATKSRSVPPPGKGRRTSRAAAAYNATRTPLSYNIATQQQQHSFSTALSPLIDDSPRSVGRQDEEEVN